MRILALDAAGAEASICLIQDGLVVAERRQAAQTGQPAILPALLDGMLDGPPIDLVAVGVGPGGFTGIRTALALAGGLAAGRGVGIVGVAAGEALAMLAPNPQARPVWAAIGNRRGGIFLLRPGAPPASLAEVALPAPACPILVVGSAAAVVVARLLARGQPAMLGHAGGPMARGIALAAAAGVAGPVSPLYVDQPAVT